MSICGLGRGRGGLGRCGPAGLQLHAGLQRPTAKPVLRQNTQPQLSRLSESPQIYEDGGVLDAAG